jgi:hypothetical protein
VEEVYADTVLSIDFPSIIIMLDDDDDDDDDDDVIVVVAVVVAALSILNAIGIGVLVIVVSVIAVGMVTVLDDPVLLYCSLYPASIMSFQQDGISYFTLGSA